MFIIKNKYENIEILDLEDEDELIDRFCDVIIDYDNGQIASIVGRSDLINYVFTMLLCKGYTVGKIFFDPYDNECDYCLSVDSDCNVSIDLVDYLNKFDNKTVVFVNMDNADQCVIDYCIGMDKRVYLFEIDGESDEYDCELCDCKDNCHEYNGTTDDGAEFHISVKGDLNLDEAIAKLDEVEARMERINESLSEMDIFRKLFNW